MIYTENNSSAEYAKGKQEMRLKRTKMVFTSFILKEICLRKLWISVWNADGTPALRAAELTLSRAHYIRF